MTKVTIDTSLLVYTIDTADPYKHRAAQAVLDRLTSHDTVVCLQALAEFFYVTTRKGRLSTHEASAQVADWKTLFPVVTAHPRTLSHAISGVEAHRMAFWDAMLWATAQEAGVELLLTEDFQDQAVFEGVRFIDPFKHEDLSAFLAP